MSEVTLEGWNVTRRVRGLEDSACERGEEEEEAAVAAALEEEEEGSSSSAKLEVRPINHGIIIESVISKAC